MVYDDRGMELDMYVVVLDRLIGVFFAFTCTVFSNSRLSALHHSVSKLQSLPPTSLRVSAEQNLV